MTIAMCYLSSEGVVLGADSTSTTLGLNGRHYLNHEQKLFEVGEDSTIGILTWGLGGFWDKSYRTMFADLGAFAKQQDDPPIDIVAQRWCQDVWKQYTHCLSAQLARLRALHGAVQNAGSGEEGNCVTIEEKNEYFHLLQNLPVGFCIGGYSEKDRAAKAFEIILDPLKEQPQLRPLQRGSLSCWGVPSIIHRMLFACDPVVKQKIADSERWSGSAEELDELIAPHVLSHNYLPMREAVDFVHTCIYSTIKAIKFSSLPQTCGGPIELAVITTDRRFRWVRHKTWNAAISEV